MPRLLLFCLVSSQLAMVAVMAARPLNVFDGAAAMSGGDGAEAPSGDDHYRLHVHSLLESRFAESPLGSSHHKHSPFDRTFAGGKIILGGLAAAIFAAVFFYIRITRRNKTTTEPKS